MFKKRIAKIIAVFLALIMLPSFAGCTKIYVAHIWEEVFGSLTCNADLYSFSTKMDTAKKKMLERFAEIDNAVNTTKASSEIYKFNNGESLEYVEVGATFYELLTICAEYYGPDKTDGYFDPTIYPLVELWGMNSKNVNDDKYVFIPPTIEKVHEVMEYCNFTTAVSYKEEDGKYFVKKNHPKAKLDFGGLAKGYAADEVVKIARENGVEHAFITISGNTYMLGKKYNGQPWRIRITNPRKESYFDEELMILEFEDISAVISGDYQRYHFYDEVRYMHIINPKTGLPANVYYQNGAYTNINPETGIYDGVNSTLIVNPSSTMCDIYSTFTLLIGIEAASEYLKNNNIKGIINTEDMRMAVVGEHKIYKNNEHRKYQDYTIITDESYGRLV